MDVGWEGFAVWEDLLSVIPVPLTHTHKTPVLTRFGQICV